MTDFTKSEAFETAAQKLVILDRDMRASQTVAERKEIFRKMDNLFRAVLWVTPNVESKRVENALWKRVYQIADE